MITPQEAKEYLNDLRALPDWEAKLDGEIRKALASKTAVAGVTVPWENLARMLASRYCKAGWIAEVSDVTRDRAAAEPAWHVQVLVEDSLP